MHDPPQAGRCPRCFLAAAACLCADLCPVANRVHVAIVRHAQERKKTSNSARLAALILERVSLHEVGLEGQPFDDTGLIDPGHTWLLFPEGDVPCAPVVPPRRIIVLDGNWPQARRMRQRIAALRGLPVVRLPAPAEHRPRLRTPPSAGAMATIEAIAAALALCGEPDAAAELNRIYDLAVERTHVSSRRGYKGRPLAGPRSDA
ncbi:MAG TPA: DTW domain-containing protein [Kofleriaceae bacterium]|nr:DTW domain-containing protein [Kofleriaceae bacterium]